MGTADLFLDENETYAKRLAADGVDTELFVAAEGMYEGAFVYCGAKAQLAVGNVMPLSAVPEGTVICNVEARVGDRGAFARCSGLPEGTSPPSLTALGLARLAALRWLRLFRNAITWMAPTSLDGFNRLAELGGDWFQGCRQESRCSRVIFNFPFQLNKRSVNHE